MEYEIHQVSNLRDINIENLLLESKKEGYQFVERLINDYLSGKNCFNKTGECLFAVSTKECELAAIGGLNRDPFSNHHRVGRVRRFYVGKRYRRDGVGTLLLRKIMIQAKSHYEVLVLNTDNKEADSFYRSIGFQKEDIYPKSTHYIILNQEATSSKL